MKEVLCPTCLRTWSVGWTSLISRLEEPVAECAFCYRGGRGHVPYRYDPAFDQTSPSQENAIRDLEDLSWMEKQ